MKRQVRSGTLCKRKGKRACGESMVRFFVARKGGACTVERGREKLATQKGKKAYQGHKVHFCSREKGSVQ